MASSKIAVCSQCDRARSIERFSHPTEANIADASIRTLEGSIKSIPQDTVAALRGKLRGSIVLPGEDGYDAARSIWNAMVDRRPGLVVRCLGAADVIDAVKLARDEKLLVAVRSGGHNIAGNAVCDGGLMIDLSSMKSVRVDGAAKRAWVEPGATLADVDKETQSFGLVLPTGINSTTGIAGLTLGGGFGWVTRKFGLTIDNLLSADVVTANGELLRASPAENPDLFWALRGGGGNFGIVTSFEFKLHELGLQVISGLVVHPFADAQAVLEQYRQALESAPDELTCWAVMRQAPPLPFLPQEWHGKEVVVLAMCFCGDIETGEKATARLRSIGKPIVSQIYAYLGSSAQCGRCAHTIKRIMEETPNCTISSVAVSAKLHTRPQQRELSSELMGKRAPGLPP